MPIFGFKMAAFDENESENLDQEVVHFSVSMTTRAGRVLFSMKVEGKTSIGRSCDFRFQWQTGRLSTVFDES